MAHKKDGLILLILASIITVFLSSGVSAFTLNFAQGMYQIIAWIEDILGPAALVILGSSEYLFERTLLLVVILIFTKLVLSKVPVFKDKTGAVWIVAVVVSILSARFGLEWRYLQVIFLPYTVLGIVLSAGIPLIIFFSFVKSMKSSVLRKVLWILMGVIFIAVWASRYNEIGSISWIYFWAAVISLVFMLADGTIRRLMIKNEMDQLNIDSRDKFITEVRRDLGQLKTDLRNNIISKAMYERMKYKLESNLHSLMKK